MKYKIEIPFFKVNCEFEEFLIHNEHKRELLKWLDEHKTTDKYIDRKYGKID